MKKVLSTIIKILIVLCALITPIYVKADQLNTGVYNFKCVAGGRYMNVYAGNDWDGANVCVWDKDGSPEQNFRMEDRGGNRYVLFPQSSGGRVVDANRGNSYSNPLQAGNNIDIWQTNDAPAQEWYIDDRGNGRYTIELVAARGLVITCDNPWSNNGNCSLQAYNGSENQLWYLERADGGQVKPTTDPAPAPTPAPTPEPETKRTGYVANTGGVVLRVRAQANTNCEILGTIAEGTPITVKGDGTVNGFYKVEYNGRDGYCHGDYISFDKPQDASSQSFIRPANVGITCGFYGYANHGGLDFGTPMNTPIKASKTGTVTIATAPCSHNYGKGWNCGCSGGYGNYVKLSHGNGEETLYAHLTSLNVYVGQRVSQGDIIGYSGSTGYSTGPHMHFEIRINGARKNPEDYLR